MPEKNTKKTQKQHYIILYRYVIIMFLLMPKRAPCNEIQYQHAKLIAADIIYFKTLPVKGV